MSTSDRSRAASAHAPLGDLEKKEHVIAVVGGAVAGSEAAAYAAERGAVVLVIDQGERPYGKIEDGLPRWHEKLREQEYARIDENLSKPNVLFLPRTAVGADVDLGTLRDELGLSAVLLANGAWRDRPLPVEGIERFVDKGLVYQNAFVHWFNHYPEADYHGPEFPILDRTIVVGGGLASIDVVKILNLELYARALAARGHRVDLVKMELKGITETVEALGLTVEELGIEGCTLYYRRRKADMPLAAIAGDDPKSQAKAEAARIKIMDRVQRKYLVRFVELASPVAPIEEAGRLAGLVFQKNRFVDGKLEPIPGERLEARAPMIVSSIGSIPQAIPGVPTKGELYDYADWVTGELHDLPGVFGLGNVLTGKGNIKDSRVSSVEVATHVVSAYLGLEPERVNAAGESAREHARAVAAAALTRDPVSPERFPAIERFVKRRWEAVGYPGSYADWMAAHRPR
jgi:NADPH-dependent glutamate synthase beta subunit-like oxidoreductase